MQPCTTAVTQAVSSVNPLPESLPVNHVHTGNANVYPHFGRGAFAIASVAKDTEDTAAVIGGSTSPSRQQPSVCPVTGTTAQGSGTCKLPKRRSTAKPPSASRVPCNGVRSAAHTEIAPHTEVAP